LRGRMLAVRGAGRIGFALLRAFAAWRHFPWPRALTAAPPSSSITTTPRTPSSSVRSRTKCERSPPACSWARPT
jgi:hypothetical protein